MEFLNKIETLINNLLMKLWAGFLKILARVLPKKVLVLWDKFQKLKPRINLFIKNLPATIKALITKLITFIKSQLTTFDIKGKISQFTNLAKEQYKKNTASGKGLAKLHHLFLAPFFVVSNWLKSLSTGQTLLLMGFTAASFLAVVNMIFSSQRLIQQHSIGRVPASTEEEVPYERPDYYKQETRHLTITNFRLPVYAAEVNELKSVDIDFMATMSNRNIKRFLEINEFQLRDHFINHFEPLIATFPLEEEGKEVICEKLRLELNEFLRIHNQEGEVESLRITYILAN